MGKLIYDHGAVFFEGATELGIAPIFQQSIYDKDLGRWRTTDRVFLCHKNCPIVYCMSTNQFDKIQAQICRHLGATLIYCRDNVTQYDEDPYGRKVPRWKVDQRIYDLRSLVGCTKELHDIMAYEEYQLVKNYLVKENL